MHVVFVTGAIVAPLCAMWMVIAEGWRSLRHPLELHCGQSDPAGIDTASAGWRLYFRVHRAERVCYRFGLVGGAVCLAVAAVAWLTSR
jgi:hypothetical protein